MIPTRFDSPMKTLKNCLILSALMLAGMARAGLNVPYGTDASTLHLWHFDDLTNAPNSTSFQTVTDAVPAGPINMLLYGIGGTSSGAASGTPPFTNVMLIPNTAVFGTLKQCLMLTNGFGGATLAPKVYAYAGSTNSTAGYLADTTSFRNPTSGAFTFEALVYIAGNIFSTSIGNEWEILCGDNNADSGFTRGWQFRLQAGATPSLNLNFITASGGTAFNQTVNLPTSGNNPIAVGNWYHVAATYTGNAPTNGDTQGVMTFYWTLFDANRTNADVLASFTNAAWGTLGGTPIPAVGGSARRNNGIGNAGGLNGFLDEVRVSNVARRSGEMVFNTTVPPTPPTFVTQPPTNTLVGYGQNLALVALATGSSPLSYQWQATNSAGGWTNVPGQTAGTLSVNPVKFGNAGSYRLVVTNQFGTNISVAANVTVGAVINELFGTGYDTNGVYDTGLAGASDPHYTLVQSADANHLGPNLTVWNMFTYPIAANGGFFANPDGASSWVGPQGNSYTSPGGTYVYRTTFLLDSVDLTKPVKLTGTWWTGNIGTNIVLNGVPLGFSTAANQQSTGFGFTLTNGFVAGLNTLDFIVPVLNPNGTYQESALRVEVSGIGLARAAGVPVILNQPVSHSVHDGALGAQSSATFSVVATGRPPLSYQWWADGAPVTDATNRTLSFINPTANAQGTNFSVVIANDSGSVTSSVAVLTVLTTNQAPLASSYTYTIYSNTTLNVNLSSLYNSGSDLDGDPFAITWDGSSTNGAGITQSGIQLTYTPVADYVGADQFNYYLSDTLEISAGAINVNVVALVPPGTVTATASGGQIILSGSGASPGGSFHVLSTTNLLMPLANWNTAASGNFNNSGSFNLSQPVSSGVPQMFYKIVVP